jgi:hypothetical protein
MISKEKADAIRALADENGYIEPRDVVAAARDPGSPLHDEFPWDTQTAAEAYWIDQARRLIRLVKIEITIDEKVIRSVAYVVDPDRPPRSRRYVDLTVAATHQAMSQEILFAEMERVTAAIRRAQEVATVLGLRPQLDVLLDNVRNVVDAAEAAVARMRAKPKAKAKKVKARRSQRGRAEARV